MRKRKAHSKPFSMFAFQDIITSVTGILILITLILALELVNQTQSSPKNQTVELNASLEKQLEDIGSSKTQLQNQFDLENRNIPSEAFLDADSLKKNIEDVNRLKQNAEDRSPSLQDKLVKVKKQNRRIQKVDRSRMNEVGQLSRLQKQLENIRKKIADLQKSNRFIYNPVSNRALAKNQWLVELTGTQVRVAKLGVRAPPVSLNGVQGFESWLSGRASGGHYFMVLLRPSAVVSYRRVLEILEQKGYMYGYDLIDSGVVVIDNKIGAGN